MVKTCASEAFNKLPAQLQTTLSGAESLLLVLDVDFEFEGRHIRDVLKDVSPSIRDNRRTFEFYHTLNRMKEQGYSLEQIRNLLNTNDPTHIAAWELDKYKFLHMQNRVYVEMPNKNRYMFIEEYTCSNWANLLA